MFDVMFPIAFVIIFVIVIGMFIVMIVSGIAQWAKNNASPVLTVEAKVVTKRTNVSHHHDSGDISMSHSSTSYYVTFQVESGDRMEFGMSGKNYGMLAEGDDGRLTFQRTRYLGFERK